MKITQRRFVSLMSENKSIRIARIFDADANQTVHDMVSEAGADSDMDPATHDVRTCKARSKDLVFSDGSYLDFRDSDFELIEQTNGIVLALHSRCEHGCHIYYYLHGVAA